MACGVGPAGCSDNPDGDEGDLQTRPLMRGRSEIGRRGDRVSSDDDGKTPGGPGLRIGMGKMINVAKNSWGKRSGLRAGGPLHKGDGCERLDQCHSRLDCATRQTGSKLTDGYQRRRRRSNKQ